MRFTKAEIKKELLENWQQIETATYPEDVLAEYADSFVPVYNHEIIQEWVEMPNEFTDYWQEYGRQYEGQNDRGIISLMTIDLFAYYQATTEECYREISEQLETQTQN